MAAAPPAICAECQSKVGRAITHSQYDHSKVQYIASSAQSLLPPSLIPPTRAKGMKASLTNTHYDEEARQEPSKINNTRSRALHKIIWVGRATAYPVRQGRDYIGCDDEQGEVVVEEGG